MKTARFPEAEYPSDYCRACQSVLTSFEYDRFVKRQVVISMIFTDKYAKQGSLTWNFHGDFSGFKLHHHCTMCNVCSGDDTGPSLFPFWFELVPEVDR